MLSLLIVGADQETRTQHALTYEPKSLYILDGTQEGISIESVRAFQQSLSLSNTSQNTRHAFILEAQNLSLPAQQSLLKTLEEPPLETQFILTATKSSDLLPTIISRCEVIHLQNTLELSKENADSAKELLGKISTSNHAKLINLSESLSKDRGQLDNLLLLLESSLHSSPTNKRARAAGLVQTCINDLKANIQPQLAIEHMLFNLKALT